MTRMRGLSHLMASDLGWVSVSRDATDVLRGHLEVARQEGTEGCSLQRVGPLTPRVAGTVLSVLSEGAVPAEPVGSGPLVLGF